MPSPTSGVPSKVSCSKIHATLRNKVARNLFLIEQQLNLKDPKNDVVWAEIMTFCAVAVRVIEKANPSKVATEFRTVEIAARLSGRPVVE